MDAHVRLVYRGCWNKIDKNNYLKSSFDKNWFSEELFRKEFPKMQNSTYFFEDIIIQTVVSSKSVNFLPYVSPVTILFSLILTGMIVMYNSKRSRMVKLINKIPGPPALPFIGNTVECNVDHDGEKNIQFKLFWPPNILCA